MKAKWLPISAAVALALGSFSASAVDFHGYMRAGVQNNLTNGGAVRCFGNGNQGHLVGRLGDECDTYAEIALTQEVFNKAKNKFTVNTLVAWGTWEDNNQWDYQGNSWQGVTNGGATSWAGERVSLREAWAGYTLPMGAQIWAGKRYYQRKDIHILDFYTLNDSGNGVGIEAIPVGNLGQASFAIVKWSNDGVGDKGDKARNVYKIDSRWSGIPMWKDASLDLAMIWGLPSTTDSQKDEAGADSSSGVLLQAEYTQGNFFGGFNKLSVSYGTNGFSYAGVLNGGNHLGDNYTPGDGDSWGIRVIDWGLIEQDKWNLGYSFMGAFKHADPAGWSHPTGHDYSFVIRPAYKWSNFTSTVFEAGYTTQTNTCGNGWSDTAGHAYYTDANGNVLPKADGLTCHAKKDHVDAYKFTLAQQFSPMTTFWARPSIRFYVSYLGGDLMDKAYTGQDDHDGEVSIGAQAEAWW